MRLTKNFHLSEFVFSETAQRHGINNTPTPEQITKLQLLCINILQPLRDALNKPIKITSGYRSPELNRKIGGSIKSQHSKGEAADIVVVGMTAKAVCQRIINLRLPYDQLIFEFESWTHVSYSPSHRRQPLTIDGNGTKFGI
jgi:zinc D-Ala-D-Ala carboxypeptidase